MDKIIKLAITEAKKAEDKYQRPFASEHEFYGVLMEEIDELWDEIKKKEQDYDYKKMKKEAIQCIAVLLRFTKQIKT